MPNRAQHNVLIDKWLLSKQYQLFELLITLSLLYVIQHVKDWTKIFIVTVRNKINYHFQRAITLIVQWVQLNNKINCY